MKTSVVEKIEMEGGYGYADLDDGTTVFVHRTEILTPDVERLRVGDRITHDVIKTDKGLVATNISLIEDNSEPA